MSEWECTWQDSSGPSCGETKSSGLNEERSGTCFGPQELKASLWEYTDIPVATPVTGKEPEQEQGRECYGNWPGFA